MTYVLLLKPGVSKLIYNIVMCYNAYNADFLFPITKSTLSETRTQKAETFSIRKKTSKKK